MLRFLRHAALLFLCGPALAGLPPASGDEAARVRAEAELQVGRALYLEGRRVDGTPLRARRPGGQEIAGAHAACVNCHRRSALGGSEGRSFIPPIRTETLLRAQAAGSGPSAIGVGRPAYAEASLRRALATGVDPGGRSLDFLMPRYELQEQEVRGLMAYLGSLSEAPGLATATGPLHFATVIAPGVPPQSRQAMVDVLQACFAEHNAGRKAERGRRKLATEMSLRQPPTWMLHVWDLQGEEASWDAQLARRAQEQTVFGMVGGVGAASWAPVHGFCEKGGLPCVFPHVELPVDNAPGFYPLYLSRGVLLEAALMAQHIAALPARGKVVQVLRDSDDTAKGAADALRYLLVRQGISEQTVQVDALTGSPALMEETGARDVLVLWLRPADLQRLAGRRAPAPGVLVSATLAGRDAVPLPRAWKEHALMAYPFELPEVRYARTQRMQEWLRSKGLTPTGERVQADAYLACMSLRSAMQDADEHLGREYLVEKVETNVERWHVLGLYPRLALGQGQRFASKTGYMVRFDPASEGFMAVGERSAP